MVKVSGCLYWISSSGLDEKRSEKGRDVLYVETKWLKDDHGLLS